MQGNQKIFTRCNKNDNVWEELYQWFKTPLGEEVHRLENDYMNKLLSNLFGYHLLLLGSPHFVEGIMDSRVSRRAVMDITGVNRRTCDAQFSGNPENLPICSDVLDVMVLPHILEFSESPHEVLREVERSLVAEGHVVIIGFNPFSWWIIWRWVFSWRKQIPWCGSFISITRIKDWLALLGFECLETQYFFYRPPLQHKGILNRLYIFEKITSKIMPWFGGAYVLVARKKVSTLTPIRPRWRTRQKLRSGLVEPISRIKGSIKN
jgi:SAM-dependent methyltransferase